MEEDSDQSMDLEPVLDALHEYALREWDGYKAAEANTLLQLGDNHDSLREFMAAMSPSDKQTVRVALERYGHNSAIWGVAGQY